VQITVQNRILVDTSVWVELFRKGSLHQLQTSQLPWIVTCPPIVQELLQGLPLDVRGEQIEKQVLSLTVVDNEVPIDRYVEAAELYRLGRKLGKTIRSSIDCLIAAIALKHDLLVWHHDRDFKALATFSKLKVYHGHSLPRMLR
jgi:predicted nucleic acid-binding protein